MSKLRTTIVLSFLLTNLIFAQKHYVFKVRAAKTTCEIILPDDGVWIDRDNKISIKTNSSRTIKAEFSNGEKVGRRENTYTINYENAGKTQVSVFEYKNQKFNLVHTELIEVKEPELYFCGVPSNTRSVGLQMNDRHFKAVSELYNTPLAIRGYDMQFYDGIKTKTFHGDSCNLSQEMVDLIFNKFRFGETRRLYFNNIATVMPDGKEKFLTPIEIFLERDSTKEDIAFIFAVKRVYSSKQQ